MIDKYCEKVVDHLIANKHLQSDDQELYVYSLHVLICGTINMMATVIIGLAMGMLEQSLCMFLSFFLLRKFAGGVHADKYKNCFFSSVLINVAFLFIIRFFENINNMIVFFVILACACMIVIIFSPAENKNKPLSLKEKHIYKCISIVLGLIIGVLSGGLIYKNFTIGYSIGVGMIIVSILLIADKIVNIKDRRLKKEQQH